MTSIPTSAGLEAGTVAEPSAELTPMSGFLVFLKDMRFTGSWDLPTLDRAIEVGEAIAAQSSSALIPPSRAADAVAWREQLIIREARRLEILDWLQEEIGTAWNCDNCEYSTYHANANECANCGTEFPALNLLAFKLHACGTDSAEYIEQARAAFDLRLISAPQAVVSDRDSLAVLIGRFPLHADDRGDDNQVLHDAFAGDYDARSEAIYQLVDDVLAEVSRQLPYTPAPQAVAPTGEIARLVERLNAQANFYDSLREFDAPSGDLDRRAAAALAALSAKLAEVERRGVIRFAQAILHGDDEHRTWLMDAAIAFVAGKPLPPPNGKGRAEAAEAEATDLRRKLEETNETIERQGASIMEWNALAQKNASEAVRWEGRAESAERKLEEARKALESILDACDSFQDEEGYEVAGQIRIRAKAALTSGGGNG